MKFLLSFFIVVSFLFAYKNVLILNSYSIKLPWTKNEIEGILKKIGNRNDLKIYIDFMDTKVFPPTTKRMKFFYEFLKEKYEGINFDIVITTDDNALSFIRNHYNNTLFKNSKVFFAGVNNLGLAEYLDKKIYSGVFEKKEPLTNLKFMKKVDPLLNTVYVVADNSNSAKSVFKEYMKAYEKIKNIKFVYINNQNLDEVLDVINEHPKHSMMMLLTPFSFNLQGGHINYKYSIMLLSQYFKAPIVIHTDLLADIPKSNIIGGKVTDGITQGILVGKEVLKYLNGEKMKNIGFIFEKANKMYLNVKNLEKFGVNPYSLGFKNVIYVNKPNSFYEKYKKYIISFFVILFVLLLTLVIMYAKNIQLKKYNLKIKKINESLEDKIKYAVKEISKQNKNVFDNKNELINFIVFQLKYPIIKLNEINKNCEMQKYIDYLITKINEIEQNGINESKIISMKVELEKIINLIYHFYGKERINVNLYGNDFRVETNRVNLDIIFLSLVNELLINNYDKVFLNIFLNNKNKSLTIHHNIKNNKLSLDKLFENIGFEFKVDKNEALGLNIGNINFKDLNIFIKQKELNILEIKFV
ncbi:hypothetical protein FE773_06500 [Caminibacter mediatlanticus TB-2]|uniref:Histidine kinase n=1 Tax=Caminibacter mediatlanticus TB-2 TaxID=391592 RepID=A0ABX5VB74_9BACT|nr:hypothetical protein [Caminibacter mediatlanticus]QCT94844.1 hypothetical protein FE773_06500 [Caminibacter mediatlanticus TB-2]